MNVDQPKFMQDHMFSFADLGVYLKWETARIFIVILCDFPGREFCLPTGKSIWRNNRNEAALEALRGVGGSAIRRSARDKNTWRNISRLQPRLVCRRWCAILLAAMRHDILSRPWMSDDTKEKAMAKIATFQPKIGYPDKWKDYSNVTIRRGRSF